MTEVKKETKIMDEQGENKALKLHGQLTGEPKPQTACPQKNHRKNTGRYRQLNLLTSTLEYNSLDLPQFSICKSCKAQTIKLTEGCGICGWLDCDFLLLDKLQKSTKSQKKPTKPLEVKTSSGQPNLLGDKSAKTEIPVTDIPCLVKQPGQPELKGLIKEDQGARFTVYIPDLDSTVTVCLLFVYPDLKKLDKSSRKNIPEA